MVIYGIKLLGIKNHIVVENYTEYNYASEIVCIIPNEDLVKEIITSFKEKFKESDEIIIQYIDSSHKLIESNFSSIPDNLKEIYNKSKELWSKKEVQEKLNIQFIQNFYKSSIKDIEFLRNQSKQLGLLDSQEYLNFLDKLNELSIDLDRDDSK